MSPACGFRVSGFGFRVSGFGFWNSVPGMGVAVSGFRYLVSDFEIRVFGCRVFEYYASGFGLRFWGWIFGGSVIW